MSISVSVFVGFVKNEAGTACDQKPSSSVTVGTGAGRGWLLTQRLEVSLFLCGKM